MPVGFLSRFQIAQDAQRIDRRVSSNESAGGLHKITRPHQVIAAEILVAFVESPGNGKAGNDAAEEIF